MPRYDYRCGAGHETEATENRETDSIACFCGQASKRVISAAHVAGAVGFTQKPTREHYVRLDRAINAQHEVIDQCRRAGIQPPDLYGEAKRRIVAGEVEAIT